MQQFLSADQAIINVHEAAGLFAVAPNLNFVLAGDDRHRNLARNSGGRLFSAAIPSPVGTIDVMIADRHAFSRQNLLESDGTVAH